MHEWNSVVYTISIEKKTGFIVIQTINNNIWLAYQMNRPSFGDGIIVAFRRNDCPLESIIVNLHGVDSNEKYLLFNEDTQVSETLSGEVLKSGYTLKLADKPGSVLIRYKKVL